VADSGDPNDPASVEYYRRRRAIQQGEDYKPPEKAPSYPPAPPGQILTDSGPLGTVTRDALIAANQAGVGVVGLPLGAANLLWRATGHTPPAWTESQGPGSYGEFLTLPGLNPSTPFERELSAGARQVGSALPFAAAGAMGPIALGVNALGGFGGQALTEAGHPNLGAAVQIGSGLASGLGSASRMPGAPPAAMWTSVPRSGGPTARDMSAFREKNIDDYLMWDPITRWLGPAGLGINYLIRRRNYNAMIGGGAPSGPSGATIAARQVLGGAVMGGTVGASSALENAPPSISYAAPGQPAQPPGVTWTPPQ